MRQALLNACTQLATPDRGPTLREMAAVACVGLQAARETVKNMSRAGQLHRVRDRKVEYRNRPVAEYVPKAMLGDDDGFVDLAQVLRVWG